MIVPHYWKEEPRVLNVSSQFGAFLGSRHSETCQTGKRHRETRQTGVLNSTDLKLVHNFQLYSLIQEYTVWNSVGGQVNVLVFILKYP